MASPRRTTGSLYPAFAPDRLVGLTVKHPYAIALYARLPFVLRVPWEASVTLLEATPQSNYPPNGVPSRGLELKYTKAVFQRRLHEHWRARFVVSCLSYTLCTQIQR